MWGKWDLNQSEELHPIRKCFLLKNRQEERTTRHRPRDEWRERKDFEALNLLENSSGWAPGIGVSLCGRDDKKLPAALRTQLLHSSMCLQWMQLSWPCEFAPTFWSSHMIGFTLPRPAVFITLNHTLQGTLQLLCPRIRSLYQKGFQCIRLHFIGSRLHREQLSLRTRAIRGHVLLFPSVSLPCCRH